MKYKQTKQDKETIATGKAELKRAKKEHAMLLLSQKRENKQLVALSNKQQKLERKESKRLHHQENQQVLIAHREQRREAILNSTEYKIHQIAKRQNYKNLSWYKLDNAGLIYPPIAYKNNALFRLSVLLNKEVNPLILQKAVNLIVPRFPTICSTLKAGIFWYYLDSPSIPLIVEEETGLTCRTFRPDHKHPMIRVLYKQFEVAIEFFHTATDGSGGLALFNCLLATYFELSGYGEIKDRTNCPHYLDKPRYEETVDSFQTARNNHKGKAEHVKASHIKGEILPHHSVILRKAVCDSSSLVAVAKKYGCTITQYLASRVLDSIHYQLKTTLNNDKKPIKVSIPCNLREKFNSCTYRNFSSYFYAYYKESDTFEQLIDSVKQDFARQVNKEYFQNMINYNTNAQTNMWMRIAPLPVKNLALRLVYNAFGRTLNSSSLSNLGVVKAPREFSQHVVRYEFAFGEAFCEPIGVTMASYNGLTVITCSSIVKDTLFERHLMSNLTKDGVQLCVESTYRGEQL
ncbi:MAG: hypothetical protein PHW00_02880 [Clostridia bacterium]|nr:hypothetical protein [Clostridia bacterium]